MPRILAASAARQNTYGSLKDFVAAYLSPAHRDNPGGGCVMAALGGDIARQSPGVRRALTSYVSDQLGRLARRIGGRRPAARRRAIATLCGLVGALVLARAVEDPVLSDEILATARAAYAGD